MSTLYQIGIEVSSRNESLEATDPGIRRFYAAVLQRALHDLIHFKEDTNKDREVQDWAIKAQQWFFDIEPREVSFSDCCYALGLNPDIYIRHVTKLGIWLSDKDMQLPASLRGKRKPILSVV